MALPRRKLLSNGAALIVAPFIARKANAFGIFHGGGGIIVPQPAIAVARNYNILKFYDDFLTTSDFDLTATGNPGFTWYPQCFPFQGRTIGTTPNSDYSIANSILSLTGHSIGTGGYQLQTRGYLGPGSDVGRVGFLPGGYFEFSAKVTNSGTMSGGADLWMQDIQLTRDLVPSSPTTSAARGEIDYVEWDPGAGWPTNVSLQTHVWGPGSIATFNATLGGSPAFTGNPSAFNTYGLDHVTVAQGGGTGSLKRYVNGTQIGSTLTYTNSDTISAIDLSSYMIFMSNGDAACRMDVDYIVWWGP